MGFIKPISIYAIFFTLSQAASFQNLHDMCDITDTQKCPNKPVEVKLLQKFLNVNSSNKIIVSGKWSKETKNAVMTYQSKHGLPATGYVGKITKNQLDKDLSKLLAKLHKKADSKPQKLVKTEPSTKKEQKKATKTTLAKNKKTDNKKIATAKKVDIKKLTSYEAFRRSVNLRKSFAVYKNAKLLSKAGKARTLLKIDVSEQRVKLVVNGKVALSAPCTTGAKHKLEPNTRTYRDKHTPLGTFKILEKIATKRSTIFGNIYRHGKLIYHGDRRKYRGSWRGVKFVGAPLYKWMRLTSSGIGLHASNHVHRYPGSNGCIRLPKSVANTLFSKLRKGTTVKVVN